MAYAKPVASFADIVDEFMECVRAVVWCAAATMDTRNRPRSRVSHPIWDGSAGRITTNRNPSRPSTSPATPTSRAPTSTIETCGNPSSLAAAPNGTTRRRASAGRGRCRCVGAGRLRPGRDLGHCREPGVRGANAAAVARRAGGRTGGVARMEGVIS